MAGQVRSGQLMDKLNATGFASSAGGMLAALPVIDDLVAGHSFEALRSVAEVIARA